MAEQPENSVQAPSGGIIETRLIEEEMKQSYLDYAMSVIVGRALPDVRDGLKPVHRRILYAMHELGVQHNKPFKKSARIVGETMGKYHPHGDSAIYETLVRMAQDFSMRYLLVDGQGNFGSVDGDGAAAMRYTEARLHQMAEELLADIDKETVNFTPNFDGSLKEPTVMPSKFPNLLANGSVGIAVGMATNIPPHNLAELTGAIIHLIDKPDAQDAELIDYVKGPDFPTGGIIYGRSGIIEAYRTGRGKILVRAKTHIEENKQRKAIIVDQIPYQVNKANLIEQIAQLHRDKVVQGISDIRDESDREGMRVVIELKKDASPDVVLNQLFKHSRLQTTFGIIMLALDNNVPKVLTLREMIQAYLNHRIEITTRRTQFELTKAEKRAHLLLGLKKAIESLDQTIAIIRRSADPAVAKAELIAALSIDEVQSQAILDMRLQRLTGLERDKIVEEHRQLLIQIADLKDILAKRERIMAIIKAESQDMLTRFQDGRKTEIIEMTDEIEMEDLIKDEDVVITVSRSGYCKRVSVDTYKAQRRGGKGIIGAAVHDDDIIDNMFIGHSKSYVLCFTNIGKVHWLKAYQIPEASRTAGGKHIANLLPLQQGEQVTAFLCVRDFKEGQQLMLVTKNGIIKKSELMEYANPRTGGIRGITLDEGDELINAFITDGNQLIIIATKHGMAVKFHEQDARSIGRTARGVRGITLDEGDEVIDAVVVHDNKSLLTVTEHGYGKRTKIDEYRLISRGGKGVINIQTSERNGSVVAVREVEDEDGLLLISRSGIVMRTRADQISVIGRNTQGVRIMRLEPQDVVASVSKVEHTSDEEIEKVQNDEPIVQAPETD